jgi:hypothetical protein
LRRGRRHNHSASDHNGPEDSRNRRQMIHHHYKDWLRAQRDK